MMIGKPGEAGVCKTFNNQDHCGESEKIAKMKLACSGNNINNYVDMILSN